MSVFELSVCYCFVFFCFALQGEGGTSFSHMDSTPEEGHRMDLLKHGNNTNNKKNELNCPKLFLDYI